jgi:hypothetical protein
MRKNVLIFAAIAAISISLFSVSAASATAPPAPNGAFSCGLTGSVTLKKPLTPTAGFKLSFKGAATGTNCDNSGLTQGPHVTGVSITASGTLPPTSSCSTLLTTQQLLKTKIQIKFAVAGTTAKDVDNTFVQTFGVATNGSAVTLNIVTQPINRGAFMGHNLKFVLGTDLDASTLESKCTGTSGLSMIAFGSGGSASLSS